MTSPPHSWVAPVEPGEPDRSATTQQEAGERFGIEGIGIPSKRRGMLDVALSWAATGKTVLPLRRLSNVPHAMLGSGWTRQTVGTRDPGQIREWWSIDPWANVGIVNGPRSGVLIIDTDRHGDGPDGGISLRDWCDEHQVRVAGVGIVETPGGGTHYWLRWPEGAEFRVANGWLPGVDVPWQVAVPPSPRRYGDAYLEYRWVGGDLAALPVAPEILVGAIEPGTQVATLRSGDVSLVGVLESGSRNDQLLRLACLWYRQHWPHDDIVIEKARAIYDASVTTGFSWSEALRAVESARRFIVPQVERENAWAEQLRSAL